MVDVSNDAEVSGYCLVHRFVLTSGGHSHLVTPFITDGSFAHKSEIASDGLGLYYLSITRQEFDQIKEREVEKEFLSREEIPRFELMEV